MSMVIWLFRVFFFSINRWLLVTFSSFSLLIITASVTFGDLVVHVGEVNGVRRLGRLDALLTDVILEGSGKLGLESPGVLPRGGAGWRRRLALLFSEDEEEDRFRFRLMASRLAALRSFVNCFRLNKFCKAIKKYINRMLRLTFIPILNSNLLVFEQILSICLKYSSFVE